VEEKVKAHISDARDYCEKNNVYDLLTNLMTEVVRAQPDDVVGFLKDRLSAPPAVRVCIIGPPGSESTTIANQVAEKLGATAIHLDDVVKSENGDWVPDSQTNLAMLDKLKNQTGSWVVSNYPRTRNQALSMMNAKCLPHKMIVCNVSNDQLETAFAAKGAAAQRDMQQYSRHLQETMGVLPHLVMQVDASKDAGEVMQAVTRSINYNAKSCAPHVPIRICVVGNDSVERNGRAADVAKLYGAVHVKYGAGGINSLEELKTTLSSPECKSKGWILEGCPNDSTSADFLHSAGLAPHRMVALSEVPEAVQQSWSQCFRSVDATGDAGTKAIVDFVNETI